MAIAQNVQSILQQNQLFPLFRKPLGYIVDGLKVYPKNTSRGNQTYQPKQIH